MGFVLTTMEGYSRAVVLVEDKLTRLTKDCERLELSDMKEMLREDTEKIKSDRFNVSVIGEFKRGKSTLINALLGAEICPSDRLPATAALNRVVYGEKPGVTVIYKDGHSEQVEISALRSYVTKLDENARAAAQSISEVVVAYPLAYCKNNVDIVDTPGLNDEATMTEVTLSMLPKTDAALFVMMATSPFSETERDFLVNKMLSSDLGRVIFVVNAIDILDEDEAEEIVKFIEKRIQEFVMEKTKRLYGEDSEEYAKFIRAIGKPKVVGVSSRKALRGRLKGDDALLEESNFLSLEKAVENLLTKERGAISLQAHIGKLSTASAAMRGAINMRRQQFEMTVASFEEKRTESLAALEKLSKKRDMECEAIAVSAKNAYQKLLPQVDAFFDMLSSRVSDVIDDAQLQPDDLKKENADSTQQRMIKLVENATNDCFVDYTERVQNEMQALLSAEVERLDGFESEFLESLSSIEMSFCAGEVKTKENALLSGTIDAVAGVIGGIPGVGSAYLGYRKAGIKGLLLGGGIGAVSAVASFTLINTVLAAAGIAVGGPVALAGTAIVYLLTGKLAMGAVNKFLKPDMSGKYKSQFKKAVLEKLISDSAKHEQRDKLRDEVTRAFDGVKQTLMDETERLINSTKSTLDSIASDLDKSEEERIETEKMFAEVLIDVDSVESDMQPLKAALEV